MRCVRALRSGPGLGSSKKWGRGMFERTQRGPYNKSDRSYSNEEDAVIEAMFEDNKSDRQISAALTSRGKPRSIASVASRRAALGLEAEKAGFVPVVRNDAFREAMMAAVNAGSENAKFGVIKDSTPFVGKLIHAEPVRSSCGSTSAMCADT